ncbi:MAG: hypothetical protein FWG28_01505 [Clostridiales bacterium]|nr:hypothetical protein [Clostridiales bacterium]
MEHINVLNKIIEADVNARALTDAAAARQEHLVEEIDRDKAELREGYMRRAGELVEAEFARERASSALAVAELDEKLRRDLRQVDEKLALHRELLAEKVFSMVVEDA